MYCEGTYKYWYIGDIFTFICIFVNTLQESFIFQSFSLQKCRYAKFIYVVKKEIVDNNVIIINNVFVNYRNQKNYLGEGDGKK